MTTNTERDLVIALRAYQEVSFSTVTRKGMKAALGAVRAVWQQEQREVLRVAIEAAARPVITEEARDLIEQAREWPRDGVNEGPLINALADALEAAFGGNHEPTERQENR